MALFKRRHIHKIHERQKTQTRRTHKRTWKVGRTYAIRDRWFGKPQGHIRITRRFEEKLGEISLEDVKKEGFSSLEEFRSTWEEIYGPGSWDPEQAVTVYEFELVSPDSEERSGPAVF